MVRLLTTVLLAAGPAAARTYSPIDLANLSIATGQPGQIKDAGQAITINGEPQACVIDVDHEGTLSAKTPDDCPAIFRALVPLDFEVIFKSGPPLKVVAATLKSEGETVTFKGETLTLPTGHKVKSGSTLAVLVGKDAKSRQWLKAIVLPEGTALVKTGGLDVERVVGEQQDGTFHTYQVEKVERQLPPERMPPERMKCAHDANFDGQQLLPTADYIVCFDATGPGSIPRMDSTDIAGAVMLPNRTTLVVVRYNDDAKDLKIEMDGTLGLYSPKVDSTTGVVNASGNKVGPKAIYGWVRFAPRLPGTATVKVTVTLADGKANLGSTELLVDTTYIGALRIGISALFGDAVERSYEARKPAGSAVSEIVATSRAPAEFEIVAGFAPFLEGLFKGRLEGRAYSNSRFVHFAPYVGLGVIGTSGAKIDFLKSLYFGAEWEFTRSFTLAATVVLRRVSSLSSGLQIGSPVTDATGITTTGYGLGFGIVLNVSPDFFKFATTAGKP